MRPLWIVTILGVSLTSIAITGWSLGMFGKDSTFPLIILGLGTLLANIGSVLGRKKSTAVFTEADMPVTPKKTFNPLIIAVSVFTAIIGVVSAAELEFSGQAGAGAEKKKAATLKIKELTDPIVPDQLEFIVDGIISFGIDAAVTALSKTGFFGGSDEVLKELSGTTSPPASPGR